MAAFMTDVTSEMYDVHFNYEILQFSVLLICYIWDVWYIWCMLHPRCPIFTSSIWFCSGSPWRVERTISTVIRNLKLAKVEIVRNLLRSPTPATFLSNLRNQSRLYKVQNICICLKFVNISDICTMVMI